MPAAGVHWFTRDNRRRNGSAALAMPLPGFAFIGRGPCTYGIRMWGGDPVNGVVRPHWGIGRRRLAITAELRSADEPQACGPSRTDSVSQDAIILRVKGASNTCYPASYPDGLVPLRCPRHGMHPAFHDASGPTVSHDVINEPYRGWPQRRAIYAEFLSISGCCTSFVVTNEAVSKEHRLGLQFCS